MISLFSGINVVNAEAYDQNDFVTLITKSTPITKDDTLTVGDNTYIGPNGALTINDGSITFSIDNSSGKNRVLMTINGNVTLNDNEKFFIKIPDALESAASDADIEGFSLLVSKDAIFNINGTVIIPNAGNGKVTNNGTINVNGAVELRSEAYYSATGTTNVYGRFVIYGIDGQNLDSTTKFSLKKTGAVYTDYDFSIDMFLSAETGMKVVPATDKDYKSVTSSVVTANQNNTFRYGYELAYENNTEPEEDINNPNTYDGISNFIILAIVSLGATIGTIIYIKKEI